MKTDKSFITVRIGAKERDLLWSILFSRYPEKEWGTFIELAWRESANGMAFTLKRINAPLDGDLNCENWMTEINSSYFRKVVRKAEESPFAVGFVHSHPEKYETRPSPLDDDMEEYCSSLLRGYSSKPFLSLIFSRDGTKLSASGRVYWQGRCYQVVKFFIEGTTTPTLYNFNTPRNLSESALKRVARLASAFSTESANILAGTKVGIVGLSGTGSPVCELLARAGVGQLVLVDPDTFSDSNLERVHGSGLDDVDSKIPKVLIAKRHVGSINPDCRVTAIKGHVPQVQVVDALLTCDIVVGCTDLHSSRVSLNELAIRYLVPVIDMGVSMEGKNGEITGQVLQINKLFPLDPCVYCRGMISSQIVAQELLSDTEQNERMSEAAKARKEERPANAYWADMPQLNTVGYLTTLVGSLSSAFVIGYLTTKFDMPKNRLELTLTSKGTQLVERNSVANSACICQSNCGGSDQDLTALMISAPKHWPQAIVYSD